MKVLHIIPAAFEYFDDIKSAAFKLVEGLNSIGVETEALTLNYGTVTKKIERGVSGKAAPSYSLITTENIDDAISGFSDFDIVHLHCPFLGAAGKILRWKLSNPNKALALTYYRDVKVADFFSVFVGAYNSYYFPKIFKLADAVVFDSTPEFNRIFIKRHHDLKDKIFEIGDLDNSAPVGPTGNSRAEKQLAYKYLMVYNEICHKSNK